MIIPLLKTEIEDLKSLRKYCRPIKVDKGQVEPITDNSEIQLFTEGFLQRRGMNFKKDFEGLHAFGHVGMHTDSIHKEDVWTLIIPVKGRGNFCYYNSVNSQSIQDDTFEIGYSFIFNDHRPHSFISFSKICFALLVDIPKTEALKFA